MVSIGPLGPPPPRAALILAPACSQIHRKLPADPFPFWKKAGFTVPSCNSSPGHRPKASRVEVFLLELWSDGAQPGRARALAGAWTLSSPNPPLSQEAPPWSQRAAPLSMGRVLAETCPQSGAGWRAASPTFLMEHSQILKSLTEATFLRNALLLRINKPVKCLNP